MATLYDIVKQIEQFQFEVDETTGEILNMDQLDALELERDTKIENIALYIKNLKADASMYADEEKAFSQRKKAAENKAERLRQYLAAMLAGEKFKSPRVVVSYRHSESVDVQDVDALPALYVVTEKRPDKTAIKQAIKNGETVPGAALVGKDNIQVK